MWSRIGVSKRKTGWSTLDRIASEELPPLLTRREAEKVTKLHIVVDSKQIYS